MKLERTISFRALKKDDAMILIVKLSLRSRHLHEKKKKRNQ